MKTRLGFFGIILGLALVAAFSGISPTTASVGQEDIAAVVKGNNMFAFDLYKSVSMKEAGNLFFSPYSISSALAMTHAGARGVTADQMEKTLRFDFAAERLNPGFGELMKKFNSPGKSYQLSVANALWGQRGTFFYPDFVEITRRYYGAGFMEVDYAGDTENARLTINNWVEEKTNHKIVELLKEGVLDNLTRLVLTNAIYFKGRWATQFSPEMTVEAPFYASAGKAKTVPLMALTGEFKYAVIDGLQILELPYTGNDVVMDILLPERGSDPAGLVADLRSDRFESWLERMAPEQVQVFLPRFKMEQELSLGAYLQNMGMKDAFSEESADFSGMSDTFLYITAVIHKAFVEVNEEGTEAAAATAVVMGTKSAAAGRTVVFRADHPFLFLIRDVQTGSILFMGRMIDPGQ